MRQKSLIVGLDKTQWKQRRSEQKMIESKRFAYPFKKNFNGMLLRSVNVFAYFPVFHLHLSS